MIPLNFTQFLNEFKSVLSDPRPWMHARFGDGEGIVMGYPERTGEKSARARWSKWLGGNKINMFEFSKKIREAVKYCDIVGTPCKRHQKVNQDWRNVIPFMRKYELLNGGTRTCCMDCTVELQTKGFYKELLSNMDYIGYISCRDVTDLLRYVLNIKEVRHFHLPPQRKPFAGEILTDQKHYPNCYDAIKKWLCNIKVKDELFLVGAGGLGKIYCQWIKERGGIALDVGSLFDGWKGLITRSYLRDIGRFAL